MPIANKRMTTRTTINKGLLIVVTCLTILLFTHFSSVEHGLLVNELWNTGHLLLFGTFSYLLQQTSLLKKRQLLFQFAFISTLTAILSISIEFIQAHVGRDFSYIDMMRNFLGAYTVLFACHAIKRSARQRMLFFSLSAISALLGLTSLILAATDAAIIQYKFPIIADFETPFELDRWETSSSVITLDKRNANNAMNIQLLPGKYPGVTLKEMPHDWHTFNFFEMQINNGSADTLNLELKIYDGEHIQNGYHYHDRFNYEFTAAPGMNQLRIPVSEIRDAPETRKMNLRNIDSVSLFTVNLKHKSMITLDDIQLTR